MTVADVGLPGVTAKVRQQDLSLEAGVLQAAILNSANFSKIATDASGVVKIFNVGSECMLGYAAADVLNKLTPADISDPLELVERARTLGTELGVEIAPGFEALVFKASRGIEDIYELTYIHKDGRRLPAIVSVTALRDEDDLIIGYMLISTDNTARKQVEVERQKLDMALRDTNIALEAAKSAAEEANRAKSDFLLSMSHELRSPLSAILGFAQLIEAGSPVPTPAQQDSVQQILHAGLYLLGLINEILDLTSVESGKLVLSMQAVPLGDLANDCRAMVEPLAQAAGIELQFTCAHEPCLSCVRKPCVVRADATRIKQVLLNLLTNAIKYNRRPGRVELRWAATAGGRVRVSVEDTGPGMSEAQIAQLFQPFNRLGQEAGGTPGTGIGLVISRRLVELMGGCIGVDSTVGVGSCFWFELDAALPQGLRDLPVHTVLCIENDAARMRRVEELVVRSPGVSVLRARDIESGIEVARLARPDAILMGTALQDPGAVHGMLQLRKNPGTAHIPVIALGSDAVAHHIEAVLAAGCFDYLPQPIKSDEFARALELAFHRTHGHGGLVAAQEIT